MDKKERVKNAISGRPADCLPVGFPVALEGADAVRHFLDSVDADLILLKPGFVLYEPYDVQDVSSYAYAVNGAALKVEAIKRQLEEVSQHALSAGDVFTLGALPGVVAAAVQPLLGEGRGYEEALCMLVSLLRSSPYIMFEALSNIAEMLSRLASAFGRAGVDGLYYTALGGEARYIGKQDFDSWIAPLDKQVLGMAHGAGLPVFLRTGEPEEVYSSYSGFADVFSWGTERYGAKPFFGGLARLIDGTDEEIRQMVARRILLSGRSGLILGPDGTLSSHQSLSKLQVAVETAHLL